jgi:formylglycine-generating enzyme required for sulfatase activity
MTVVPAGSFTMGAPADEKDRFPDEGPQHVVTIARSFAAGRVHVTRDQYAAFVAEMQYEPGRRCSWRNPGFVQEGSHPVVCVSWDDARTYANWLAKKTGKPYRLLSEAEWEYVARGQTSPGTYPRFWFGDDEKDLCRYGNFLDQTWSAAAPCNDGYARTSPAGHCQPNAFGLYDMAGNAWQLTADCWHDGYGGAPSDGSTLATTGCKSDRIVRGGSWGNNPRSLRAAYRNWDTDELSNIGFRLSGPDAYPLIIFMFCRHLMFFTARTTTRTRSFSTNDAKVVSDSRLAMHPPHA